MLTPRVFGSDQCHLATILIRRDRQHVYLLMASETPSTVVGRPGRATQVMVAAGTCVETVHVTADQDREAYAGARI